MRIHELKKPEGSTKAPKRIGYKVVDGKKVRVSKKTGKTID